MQSKQTPAVAEQERLDSLLMGAREERRVLSDLGSSRLVCRQQAVARCLLADRLCTSKHSKVAVFVETSPFSHLSGMKIRLSNLVKDPLELCQPVGVVTVFTPCGYPPESYRTHGAKVRSVASAQDSQANKVIYSFDQDDND